MGKKGISQEGLKIIACVTMLLDHTGATILPSMGLRIIGRLAFPIYCFLLAEGVAHTRNPKRYGLRLFIGALLAEIPFDLLFFGRLTLEHQSVMVTLLLGFLMAVWYKKRGKMLLPFAVCFFAAELLGTDYSGFGVALIALFVLSRGKPRAFLIQLVGMALIMLLMGSYVLSFGAVRIPIQVFALPAMILIYFYSGEKSTGNVWIQRAFYLFYPVHLTVLLIVTKM